MLVISLWIFLQLLNRRGRVRLRHDVCKCTVTQAESDRIGKGWDQQTMGTKNWRAVYASNVFFLLLTIFIVYMFECQKWRTIFSNHECMWFHLLRQKTNKMIHECDVVTQCFRPCCCSNVLTCGLNQILVWNLCYDYTLSDKNEKSFLKFFKVMHLQIRRRLFQTYLRSVTLFSHCKYIF